MVTASAQMTKLEEMFQEIFKCRDPHSLLQLCIVLCHTRPCRAQAADVPLAARDGQVVLPYAEQKFRGNVGTTYLNTDPTQFPAPIKAIEEAATRHGCKWVLIDP